MPTGIEFGSSGHLIQALARSNRIKMDSESLNLLKREVQATYELKTIVDQLLLNRMRSMNPILITTGKT